MDMKIRKRVRRKNRQAAGKIRSGRTGRFEIRTDLALEGRENASKEGKGEEGVEVREWRDQAGGISLTEVKIKNNRGARTIGKPVGTYVTLEAGKLAEKDEGYHQDVAEELGAQIRRLASEVLKENLGKTGIHVLVVGLGNPYVTPDSLGPRTLGNIQVTRRMEHSREMTVISGIVPGVMAQTGMETAEILKGIIGETKPDLVLAIDALAARSVRRLGTTIQLTNTGIHPGSGVGNHRHGLTRESLGIPVLAIGVPTVVGAAAIAQDTVSAMVKVLEKNHASRGVGDWLQHMDPEEQYHLFLELLEPDLGQLYVTPPDIDERVKTLSFTISEGIHQAFSGI